jgi:uncharacterized protein (TIGR03435 family)
MSLKFLQKSGVPALICRSVAAPICSQDSVPAAADRFEVVSVKKTPANRQNALVFNKCPGGGRFTVRGAPSMWSLQFAYQIPDTRIVGAPKWLTEFENGYDLDGTSDHRLKPQECARMVRGLLEERFKLVTHRETREVPSYSLVVSKGGPELRRVDLGDPTVTGGVLINGAIQQTLAEPVPPVGWGMGRLADVLGGQPAVGRNVEDKTGLSGVYQFSLSYAITGDDESRPSVFAALQEQVGLKLEPSKLPTSVVVIDRIDRPDPN